MGIRARNVVKWLAEQKIRLDRGNALVYWFRNIIILVAGIKIIIELSPSLSIIVGIIAIIVIYILGKLDIDWLKLYQKEQELNTSKYNPHLNKLAKIRENFK